MSSENEISSSTSGMPALGVRSEKEDLKIYPTGQPSTVDNESLRDEGAVNRRRRSVMKQIGLYVKVFEQQLVEYNLEVRGIERVQENERIRLSWLPYLQAFLLWISINLAANNITLGMLGPSVYGLSFLDASLCGFFGAFVGSLVASWVATWGPVSGIRTMVCQPCWFRSDFMF